MIDTIKCVAAVGGVVLAAVVPPAAVAADWSARPITITDGFQPGGGTDVFVRFLAPELSKQLGQQVIVENRSGASGHIAAQAVARATPDGHTLLVHTTTMITSRSLRREVGYDVQRDLAPVTQLTRIGAVLVAHPVLPVRNVREFVALAKKRPGELIFASSGMGSFAHVVGELVQQRTGIRATHVPYRGAGPSTIAVLSGEATFAFIGQLVSVPHIASGRLKALAVTTMRRSPAVPDVPTLDESGVKGLDVANWYGIWAPGRTQAATVEALNQAFVLALGSPAVRARFEKEGVEIVGSSPTDFAAHVGSEVARWGEVARKAGLKPE